MSPTTMSLPAPYHVSKRLMGNKASPPSLRIPLTHAHSLTVALPRIHPQLPPILHAHHQLRDYMAGYFGERALTGSWVEERGNTAVRVRAVIYNPEGRKIHRQAMQHALARLYAKTQGRAKTPYPWQQKYKHLLPKNYNNELIEHITPFHEHTQDATLPPSELQSPEEVYNTNDTFPTKLDLIEIPSPIMNAEILAQWLGRLAVTRGSPRLQVLHETLSKLVPLGIPLRAASPTAPLGIIGYRFQISGRPRGASMAATTTFRHGSVPTSTLTANIEYGTHVEESKFGLVGVKVWIHFQQPGTVTVEQEEDAQEYPMES